MSNLQSIFKISERIARERAKELAPKGVRDSWYAGTITTRCGLCRFEKSSTKSFSKRKDLCLSCSMRDCDPIWIDISGRALTRWIDAMRIKREVLAPWAGWQLVRIRKIELQSRLRRDAANRLAVALLRAAVEGYNLSLVVREWSLFPLLVNEELVRETIDAIQP